MVLSSERIDDVTSGYVVLVHHIGYGLSAIGMFQRIAHILCDKHHVTLFVTHGADGTEFFDEAVFYRVIFFYVFLSGACGG